MTPKAEGLPIKWSYSAQRCGEDWDSCVLRLFVGIPQRFLHVITENVNAVFNGSPSTSMWFNSPSKAVCRPTCQEDGLFQGHLVTWMMRLELLCVVSTIRRRILTLLFLHRVWKFALICPDQSF